jgi:hypothetical protein
MSSSADAATTGTVSAGSASAASAGDTARRRPGVTWERTVAFVRREKYWLLLAIPYFFAWYIPPIPPFSTYFRGMAGPVNWAEHEWLLATYPQMIQPFVLPLAGLLLWARRDQVGAVWERVKASPPKNIWRRGNASVLILGCLIFIFAHFVKVKGFAVFGLLLILFGVIYQIYGLLVIRAMWVPILFSLLMISPPDSPVTRFIGLLHVRTMTIAGAIFDRIGMPNNQFFGRLDFFSQGGFSIEYPWTCSTAVIIVPTLVLLLWYGLYRRQHPGQIIILLILGTIFSFVVNLVRILVVGKIYLAQPDTAKLLMIMNDWPLVAAAFGLSLGVVQLVVRLFASAPKHVASQQKTGRALNRAGQFVNLLLSPFIALLTGLGKIGLLWKASERGIERMLSGGKKKRRRNRW